MYSLTLRVWELNPQTHKIIPTDCNLGQLKRIVNCIQVSDDDQYMYCGTTSGDVIQVTPKQIYWWYLCYCGQSISLFSSPSPYTLLGEHKHPSFPTFWSKEGQVQSGDIQALPPSFRQYPSWYGRRKGHRGHRSTQFQETTFD